MNSIRPSIRDYADIASLLETSAQSLEPDAMFQGALEKRLQAAFHARYSGRRSVRKQIFLAAGGVAALIALVILLNWAIRWFIVSPQPAISDTPIPSAPSEQAPLPDSATYDWHGTSLSLAIPLPDSPTQVNLYLVQPEQPANLESARALAARFGMEGQIYLTPGELPDTTNILIVDGSQRLYVRSDQYFQFYPNYPRWNATSAMSSTTPPEFEAQIGDFLEGHGFNFPFRILPSELYGGHIALPLTPDGSPVCYEHFKCAGLRFTFDEKGILAVDGALPQYEATGSYKIINAEEAFQQILAPYNAFTSEAAAGMMEGMHSPIGASPTWLRPRPLDQTLTLFGWLSSTPPAEDGVPLVTLDGYTVTGNVGSIPLALENTFVEATGQFHEQAGVRTFEIETWQTYDGYEDGLSGAIRQEGGQAILSMEEGERLVLPDASELPLPMENAFLVGVRQGDTFEWKSIDLRNMMGGGGGGGGSGFYQLNLTGTPVPFPTPGPRTEGGGGGGGGEAISLPKTVEGLRGMMSITIYKQAGGSQRLEYGFINEALPFPSLLLEGEDLQSLQDFQNRPVDIWGTIEMREGQPVLNVERYEIPFRDLQFQILRGRQRPDTLEGQPATLFTSTDGITYVQIAPFGGLDGSTVGKENDEVLLEALIIPGENFGGHPALRIFSASPATNPKTGQPWELSVTADQIYSVEETSQAELAQVSAVVERVELVHYMPDPRYQTGEPSLDQQTLQPAWLFSGHYSDGSEFYILVQALERNFLLPEIAPYTQPG